MRSGARASLQSRYGLESVGRACQLLKVFNDSREGLTLAELVARTGFEKTIAFRLLHTLEAEGFLRNTGGHRYSLNIQILGKKTFRIGYAAAGLSDPFSAAVSDSVRWAAARNDIDLVSLDNHNSARTAVRNAERLVAEGVDLAIEVQEHSKIAPAISSLFRDAGIPLVAVGVPHPGATFYGIDNYRVGRTAGRVLLRWSQQNWQGKADELWLLADERAGSLPRLRLSAVEEVTREALPGPLRVQYLDTRGRSSLSFELVQKHLRFARPQRTLLVGINDELTLGALQAFEQAGRADSAAAVALGGTLHARLEMRSPGTRLVACVAFFPERYGETLMRLAQEILHGRAVPAAVHTEPQILTKNNVDQFYPDDCLGPAKRPKLW